uniref:Uncharacterized protein n=1 Tax=Avena sativa TaxID=4498 RepID=A0ACD5TQW1_AVESA
MAMNCCLLVFLVVWTWWLPPMLVPAHEEQQEEEGCSAKTCGNLTISDPFWLAGKDTERSCGSLDFEVNCHNNTPILRSSGFWGFKIIRMTYEEHSLRAVDLGKLNLVQASNSCDIIPSWRNTSAKLGRPFHLSNDSLNLILYNCTEAAHLDGSRALVETKMGCGKEHKVFAGVGGRYNETADYGGIAVEGCDTCVLPVLGSSSGKANASDYWRLISSGFVLTWDTPPQPPLARNPLARKLS